MSPPRIRTHLIVTGAVLLIAGALAISRSASVNAHNASQNSVAQNAVNKVEQGEQIFRFDTTFRCSRSTMTKIPMMRCRARMAEGPANSADRLSAAR